MACATIYKREFVDSIQLFEDNLKKAKEAVMPELENAFMDAIDRGICINEMRIVETITFVTERKFNYLVEITKKSPS